MNDAAIELAFTAAIEALHPVTISDPNKRGADFGLANHSVKTRPLILILVSSQLQ
jgi:hypothetical protein